MLPSLTSSIALACPAQRAAQPLVGLRSMRGRDAVSRVEVARSLRRILAAVQPPGLWVCDKEGREWKQVHKQRELGREEKTDSYRERRGPGAASGAPFLARTTSPEGRRNRKELGRHRRAGTSGLENSGLQAGIITSSRPQLQQTSPSRKGLRPHSQ